MSAPDTLKQAAEGLTDKAAISTFEYVRQRDKTPSEGSHANLMTWYRSFMKDLQARGIPLYAHCFVRSNAEQAALLKRGVTKAGPGQSAHNHGCAVDIVHYRRHWDMTEPEWTVIGHIGKEAARRTNVKMTWGGDWRFYDPAHWELTGWNGFKKPQSISDDSSFSQAFALARKNGLLAFRWRGKEYAVKLA